MKRQLLLAALFVAGALGMRAQTDVTDTYIQNAGFDTAGDFLTSNISNTAATSAGSVSEWTSEGSSSWCYGGCIEFGSTSGKINNATIPSTNSDGEASGGALCISGAWDDGSGYLDYYQNVTLPAGNYTLTMPVNNVGQNSNFRLSYFGFTTDDNTYAGTVTSFPANTWTTNTIYFSLAEETTGKLTIGFGWNNVGSGNTPKLVVDYVKAMYTNYTSTLQSTIDRANLLYTRVNTEDTDAASTLKSAINDAQDVLDAADNTVSYQTTIDDAVTTLQSAISTAQSAITLLSGEDITFMLENADFESSTAVTGGITTYDYDAAKNGTSFSRMQVVEGWTIASNANGKSAGVFEFGSSAFLGSTGTTYTLASVSSSASEEKALGIVAVWSGTAQYKQSVTLPAGRYVVTVPVYNTAGATAFSKNLIGFVEDGGTEHLATATTYSVGSWTTETVTFDLNAETSGYMSLGYTAANAGSGNMPHLFIDNVTVTYTSAANAYTQTVASAKETINSSTYANVTGTEETALQSLIDADASAYTVEQYFTAIDNINAAVATFTAAKASYDEYAAENATATLLSTDVSSVTTVTSAETALTTAHEINVLNYTQVNSLNYTDAATTASDLFGDWTDNNVNSSQKEQHWDGTSTTTYFEQSDGYSSSDAWTMSRSQTLTLPAGSYVLKVATRASASADATISVAVDGGSTITTQSGHHGDTGLGITTAGVADYTANTGEEDTENVYANSNAGRGWEWRYIPFTLSAEGNVTLTFSGSCDGVLYQYIGFADVTLLADATATASLPLTVAKTTLKAAIASAQAIVTAAANVGDDAFQIPTSAQTTLSEAIATAQNTYDNSTATADELTSATSTLNTAITTYNNAELNDPGTGTKYYIKVATTGHAKEGNAVVAELGSTGTNNPTGYSFKASAAPADYLAQAWTFTKVSGNNYYISITMPAGEVYLTNGTNNGSAAGWADSQIQGILDADKAMAFTIASSGVDGKYNIYNTTTNSTIACQSGGALYTESGNADFAFAVASQATVGVAVGAGKYATRIFPFKPTLGDGIKAYTCDAVDGTTLTLTEATEPAANTPYILENTGSDDYSATLTAYGTASTTTYTSGLLTGTLVSSGEVPTSDTSNSYYVLQTQNEKQAFYIVKDEAIDLVAYRAYLTVPASTEVKAFFFGNDEADAINGVSTDASANATLEGVYSVNGVRQNSLQKGVNILRMSDGTTRKVIVK